MAFNASSSARVIRSPVALVPTGFGINCEAETTYALQRAGATVEAVHLNDVLAAPEQLAKAQLLVFAGGFSFGDHLGAGRALANRLRGRLSAALEGFINDGGLVLGICNGFQTMVRLGLLPSGRPAAQRVTLAHNRHGTFYDGWVSLWIDPQSPCVFTRGMTQIDLPVRHGEGRLLADDHTWAEMERQSLVALRYIDPDTHQPTEHFPRNPNGSPRGAAGLCDASGRIFGLMPHPEAFLYAENHPLWRQRPPTTDGAGLQIFLNAVQACRGR